MIVVDKSGRKIKIGQMVDIMMLGMFQAKVIGIKDAPIILSPGQMLPPHLMLACSITPHIISSGYVPEVYIIADPDPNDPLIKEAAEKGSKIVRPS